MASVTVSELVGSKQNLINKIMDNISNNLRVAIPGIIQEFDPETQTVSVQPALTENIMNPDLSTSTVNLPLLVDVPIVLSRAGGYVLTMPVQKGDECLIIFADSCIDGWFSYGGVQNQLEKRRHDLSDSFAILGTWSQPNVIKNYSTTSAQLRSVDGSSYISLSKQEIDINAPTVKINGVVQS
jgi:hypothetical protein